MTCNRCGASISGNVTEVLAWDKMHATQCGKEEVAA